MCCVLVGRLIVFFLLFDEQQKNLGSFVHRCQLGSGNVNLADGAAHTADQSEQAVPRTGGGGGVRGSTHIAIGETNRTARTVNAYNQQSFSLFLVGPHPANGTESVI